MSSVSHIRLSPPGQAQTSMRLRRSGPRLETLSSIVLKGDDVGGSLARRHYWADALQGRKTSELGTGRAGDGKISSWRHGRTLDREAPTDAPCQSWLGIEARSRIWPRRHHAGAAYRPSGSGVISIIFTQNINRVRRAASECSLAEPHWGGGSRAARRGVCLRVCPSPPSQGSLFRHA
jgi:hypothetical protein